MKYSMLWLTLLLQLCCFFAGAQVKQDNYDHLQYKNGKPWSGSKKDEKELVNYKDGKLDGIQVTYTTYGRAEVKTWYSNDIPDSVAYNGGYINNRQPLKGYYKAGKPLEGYFLEENEKFREAVTQLYLYSNGVIVRSFSRSIIAEIINAYRTKKDLTDNFGRSLLLPVITTYKDGKPYTGVVYYQFDNRHTMYEQELVNGKTVRINIAAFAENAVGVTVIEVEAKGHTISTYAVSEEKDRIAIDTQAVHINYTQPDKMKADVIITYNGKAILVYGVAFYELGEKYTAVTRDVQKLYRLAGDTIIVQQNSNRVIDTVMMNAAGRVWPFIDLVYAVDLDNIPAIAANFEKGAEQNIIGGMAADENNLLYGTDIKKDPATGTFSYTVYEAGKITSQATVLTQQALIGVLKKENGEEQTGD